MHPITPGLIDLWLWIVLLAYWFATAPFTLKTKRRKSWWQVVQHATPLYLSLYLIFARRGFGVLEHHLYESQSIGWLGTLITLVGVVIAFWARITIGRNWDGYVTLKHGHQLIRSGPYAWVRHPIYTGFIVAFLGTAVTSGQIDAFLGVAIVTVSFVLKLRREEVLLTGEFGDQYVQYMRCVPALIPLLRRAPTPPPEYQGRE